MPEEMVAEEEGVKKEDVGVGTECNWNSCKDEIFSLGNQELI